jgi:hypothetical protein
MCLMIATGQLLAGMACVSRPVQGVVLEKQPSWLWSRLVTTHWRVLLKCWLGSSAAALLSCCHMGALVATQYYWLVSRGVGVAVHTIIIKLPDQAIASTPSAWLCTRGTPLPG